MCDFYQTPVLPIFGSICISQFGAIGLIGAAVVTSISSFLISILKMIADNRARVARHQLEVAQQEARLEFEDQQRMTREQFEKQQQAVRETFEKDQQVARERFETEERKARDSFQSQQSEAADQRQARLKRELEDYIGQQKWRDERREQRLTRIHEASDSLSKTHEGVSKLVQLGPAYEDLTMISETATVLDEFAAFKLAVNHFAMPRAFQRQGRDLVSLLTEIFLTLKVRNKRFVRAQSGLSDLVTS